MEFLSGLLDGVLALGGVDSVPFWMPVTVIFIGIVIGLFVGIMPGLSASTGLALIVPFTFGMHPFVAIILLGAVYTSSAFGGTITAIAINTPGTPAAVAVALDGYALTQAGEPGRALGTSALASAVGGMVGTAVLIFFSMPLAIAALHFGPPAFFALAVFGLTIVASMESKNRLKAFISTGIGLMLMTVGLDIINAHPRFTFGRTELFDGFSFIPALIGVFAVGEVLLNIERLKSSPDEVKAFSSKMPKRDEMLRIKGNILKSSGLGAVVGAIPGAGATIAAFIAYSEALRTTKEPEMFGKGSLEGIAAPSAAAGASAGGAFVPLLTLGIPGSAATAVMIGALTLHNITPGPELFRPGSEYPYLVNGLFASLFVGNAIMLALGILGNRIWVRMIAAPKPILFPVIMAIAFVGSYAVKNAMFDVWVCFGFGMMGWLLRRNNYPTAPMVLAMILGNMAETNFRQALLSAGTAKVFFTNPLSLGILILAVLSLVLPLWKERRAAARAKAEAAQAAGPAPEAEKDETTD